MRVGPRPIKVCPRLLKKKLPPPWWGAGRGVAALWALSLFGFGGRWLGVGGVSFRWVAPGACPRRRPAPPRAPWVFARVSAWVSALVFAVGACGGFCAAVPLAHAPARRRNAPRAPGLLFAVGIVCLCGVPPPRVFALGLLAFRGERVWWVACCPAVTLCGVL